MKIYTLSKILTKCYYSTMPKWSNYSPLDTIAYSIEQQNLLREKMKKEEEERKKKEEIKKDTNKRKNKKDATLAQQDTKRLKKLEETDKELDLIRSVICQADMAERNTEEKEYEEEGEEEDEGEEDDDEEEYEEEVEEEEEEEEEEESLGLKTNRSRKKKNNIEAISNKRVKTAKPCRERKKKKSAFANRKKEFQT